MTFSSGFFKYSGDLKTFLPLSSENVFINVKAGLLISLSRVSFDDILEEVG